MNNIVISEKIMDSSGVYAIWNCDNQRVYIGSSTKMRRRVKSHIAQLKNNIHPLADMQKDFNAGNSFLVFKVLDVKNIKNLRYYENISITHFEALSRGYNKQDIVQQETAEVTAIRRLAGSWHYFYNGAEEGEKRDTGKIVE